eukprot:5823569-Prymnesium_polylepis.1
MTASVEVSCKRRNASRTGSSPPGVTLALILSNPRKHLHSTCTPVRILELPGLAGWKRHFKADCLMI